MASDRYNRDTEYVENLKGINTIRGEAGQEVAMGPMPTIESKLMHDLKLKREYHIRRLIDIQVAIDAVSRIQY